MAGAAIPGPIRESVRALRSELEGRRDLSPSEGGIVGLDARDGEAYVLVLDYADFMNMVASTFQVSTNGEIVADFADSPANADFDAVREAIAVIEPGHVALGYFAEQRALARVDIAAGPVWEDETSDWATLVATRAGFGAVFAMRSFIGVSDEQAVVSRYTDTGRLIDTLMLGSVIDVGSPLQYGPMFVRPGPRLVVLTWHLEHGTRMFANSTLGDTWETVELAPPTGERPRAFSGGPGDEIVVWTDTEQIAIDPLDHPQAAQPRVVEGTILTSFPGTIVTVEDQTIAVHEADGALRWTHASPGTPRFAMPDGKGGLLLASDRGFFDSFAMLERLVL